VEVDGEVDVGGEIVIRISIFYDFLTGTEDLLNFSKSPRSATRL
jgi:hypothetical protein